MEKKLGRVEDFFAKVGVVAIRLKGDVKVGDTIHIKGHTTDITQAVGSMQIEHVPVQAAKKGQDVGIKVNGRARKTDKVFLVLPGEDKPAAKRAPAKKKPAPKKKAQAKKKAPAKKKDAAKKKNKKK